MTLSEPLIQRLQNQRQRAGRMLTPGLKHPAGTGITPRLSPVLSGFGGSKYRKIGESLLSISGKKLGKLQPDSIDTLSSSLPQKFSNNRSLLHIQPQTNTGKNVWSEVEKVFPSQTAAGTPETPPQPGEMRQGSIIQKFEMTPRPGQSIDAFKKQVENAPKQVPAREPAAKKKLATNYRLFSRVEEIPDKQRPIDSTPSAEPPTAASNNGPESASPPVASSSPVVQRQPEKTGPLKADLPSVPSVKQTPLPENTAEDINAHRSTRAITSTSQDAKETQPPSLPLAKSSQRKTTAETKIVQDNEKKVPSALSHPKQALQENRSEIPPTQNASVLPVLQATPATRKNSLAGPQIPRAMSASPQIAQRQPEKPEALSNTAGSSPITDPAKFEPEKTERLGTQPEGPTSSPNSFVPDERKPIFPAFSQSKKETDSTGKAAVSSPVSPSVPSVPATVETPLKKYMARRAQPTQARFLNPEQMKPLVSSPKPAVAHPALVQRQKDTSHPHENSQPSGPVTAQHLPAKLPLPLPQTTSAKSADLTLVRNTSSASSFAASKPNAISAINTPAPTVPQPVLMPSLPARPAEPYSPVQPVIAPTSTTAPAPAPGSAANIVQRTEDKPEAATQPDKKNEDGQTSMDLDRLARDVMPRVKRILEIELERQAGFFRR
jgi:hypothetical protein